MIYVQLADGFEEIEALTIVDVLRRANLEVQTVSLEETNLVRGAHNIYVNADVLFQETDYESCEMIVLPGGMPGTTNLGKHEGLTLVLKEFAKTGKWLAAICAAPSVLGELSLLVGKKVTCYPGFQQHMTGAVYVEDTVVVDGNFITSRGPGTAIAFSLQLVASLKDQQVADSIKVSMIV